MNTKKWILAETGTMIGDNIRYDTNSTDISDDRNIQVFVDGLNGPPDPWLKLCFQFFVTFIKKIENLQWAVFNIGFSIFTLPYKTNGDVEIFGRWWRPGIHGCIRGLDRTILKRCQPIWTPAYLAVIEVVEIVEMDFPRRVQTILILYLV